MKGFLVFMARQTSIICLLIASLCTSCATITQTSPGTVDSIISAVELNSFTTPTIEGVSLNLSITLILTITNLAYVNLHGKFGRLYTQLNVVVVVVEN